MLRDEVSDRTASQKRCCVSNPSRHEAYVNATSLETRTKEQEYVVHFEVLNNKNSYQLHNFLHYNVLGTNVFTSFRNIYCHRHSGEATEKACWL